MRCEESIWTLIPSQYISICLEKIESKWWTKVVEGDDEIDKQQIDTTQQVCYVTLHVYHIFSVCISLIGSY